MFPSLFPFPFSCSLCNGMTAYTYTPLLHHLTRHYYPTMPTFCLASLLMPAAADRHYDRCLGGSWLTCFCGSKRGQQVAGPLPWAA